MGRKRDAMVALYVQYYYKGKNVITPGTTH